MSPDENLTITCHVTSDDDGYFSLVVADSKDEIQLAGGKTHEGEGARKRALYEGASSAVDYLTAYHNPKDVSLTIKVDDPLVAVWINEGNPYDHHELADVSCESLKNAKEAFHDFRVRFVHPSKNLRAIWVLENGRMITDDMFGPDTGD